MKERLAAVVAGAGILTASCGLGSNEQTPQHIDELVIAHKTQFFEDTPKREITDLEVGSRAVGICILFTSKESATINSGMIRVERDDIIGSIPTLSREEDELVDTFKDKTEEDLTKIYPRCDDLDRSTQSPHTEQQSSRL